MQISNTDIHHDNTAYLIENKISEFKESLNLSEKHRALLRKESGFTDEIINQLDWFSCTKKQAGALLKWSEKKNDEYGNESFGIAIPYRDTKTAQIIAYRIKLNKPMLVKSKAGKNKPKRYLQGKGSSTSIYYNKADFKKLHDTSAIIYICEGEKKAESLRYSLQLAGKSNAVVVSIPGCNNSLIGKPLV